MLLLFSISFLIYTNKHINIIKIIFNALNNILICCKKLKNRQTSQTLVVTSQKFYVSSVENLELTYQGIVIVMLLHIFTCECKCFVTVGFTKEK